MKNLIAITLILFLSVSFIKADEVNPGKKIFNKKEIINLAGSYLNNNFNIKNPAIVDVDNDGDFDILNFTDKGKVEYYKNTGTLESPSFVLENKNYDNYEINSFFIKGLPIPVFFADRDGDNDKDVFGIIKEKNNYKVMFIENTEQLDHYTLITVILILLIVLLVVLIAR